MNGIFCTVMGTVTKDGKVDLSINECRTFLFSSGRACRPCPAECERQGMSATDARRDNVERVQRRQAEHEDGYDFW